MKAIGQSGAPGQSGTQGLPTDLAPMATNQIPFNGVLWSMAQWPKSAPLPPSCWVSYAGLVEFYYSPSLGTNAIFMDDRELVAQQMLEREANAGRSMMLEELDPELLTQAYDYPEGTFYVELVSATNGVVNLLLHGTTNGIYEIKSTESLSDANTVWMSEGTLLGYTNETTTPAAISVGLRTNALFIRAVQWDQKPLDTLPLWWQWEHFGQTGVPAGEDYDGDGASNRAEYEAGSDPNTIQFTAHFEALETNQRTNQGLCEILAGVPFEIAVLINDTNLAHADWRPYTPEFQSVLDSIDGDYNVRVLVRGRSESFEPEFEDSVLTLDCMPPAIYITNPVLISGAGTVGKPYLQLKGYTTDPIAVLSYDLSNANFTVTNEAAAVIDQFFDTNVFNFTTNWFQAFDLPLATNLNSIVLRVSDLAGNVSTTNIQVTLDWTGDPVAPSLTILWPTNGTELSGDTFFIRGTCDDETAELAARIISAGNETNLYSGLVERNGVFWVDNLPLSPGTNLVELMAWDTVGNTNLTTIELVKSDLTDKKLLLRPRSY